MGTEERIGELEVTVGKLVVETENIKTKNKEQDTYMENNFKSLYNKVDKGFTGLYVTLIGSVLVAAVFFIIDKLGA